ncbi:hypothetical protein CFII64_16621 [Pseudomonas sp. CFII64]|nr:hypothetical protein CFII64_16621 [Pseudomonas sp. CFII64]
MFFSGAMIPIFPLKKTIFIFKLFFQKTGLTNFFRSQNYTHRRMWIMKKAVAMSDSENADEVSLNANERKSELMTFENPVRQRTKKWARYDLVFIDRKRKMIVTSYQHNTMASFEIHVEKRKIDEVAALLKTLMPDAEFREEEWARYDLVFIDRDFLAGNEPHNPGVITSLELASIGLLNRFIDRFFGRERTPQPRRHNLP